MPNRRDTPQGGCMDALRIGKIADLLAGCQTVSYDVILDQPTSHGMPHSGATGGGRG